MKPSIKQKSLYALGSTFLCVLLLSGWSLYVLSQYSDRLGTATGPAVKKLTLIGEIKSNLALMRLSQRGLLEFSVVHNQEKVEQNKRQFDQIVDTLKSQYRELEPMLVTQEGKAAMVTMKSATEEYIRAHQECVELCANGKPEEAIVRDVANGVVGASLTGAADTMIKAQSGVSAGIRDEAARLGSESLIVNLVVVLLAIVSVVMNFVGVNAIVKKLSSRTRELEESAEQVASAAGQVSSSSQNLAQGASEQAASLEETSSSTTEINSMTQQNAENSKGAARLATNATEEFTITNHRLEDLVVSMDQINDSSQKISKVIKIIDEIAFQTNILALNAAVEAARAGETGMGFAVVADEVRNLAQRCAQAASETTGMIEASINHSRSGKEKLAALAAGIQTLAESSKQTKVLVEEVSLASAEQANGLNQIASAITQMETVTQRNAASAEEGAAAGEQLSAQSDSLRTIVAELRILVHGGTTA